MKYEKLRLLRSHVRWGDNNKTTKISDKHVILLRKAHAQDRRDIIAAVAEQLGTSLDYTNKIARGQVRKRLAASPVSATDVSSSHRSRNESASLTADQANSLSKTQEPALV